MADLNKNSEVTENKNTDAVKASGLVSSVPVPSGEASRKARLKRRRPTDAGNGGNLLINIIFSLVLILLIASIVFLVIWFGGPSDSNSDSVSISYTVLLHADNTVAVADSSGGCIIPKDSSVYLYTDEGEINIGKVDGTTVRMNSEDGTVDVMISITADTRYTEGEGFFINGCKIAVGRELNCRFSGYTDTCSVISMNVSE